MASGRRAYEAIRHHLVQAAVCAVLLALCVGCCAIASTAPAATLKDRKTAKGASSQTSAPARKAHRRGSCAKRASFHSSKHRGTRGRGHRSKHRHRCTRSLHRRHVTAHRGAAQRETSSYNSAPVVPDGGVCPNAQLRPNAQNLEQIRTATLCLVNGERLSHGESPLAPNQSLQSSAQGHSDDMAVSDYFEHDGRNGETPLSRMRAAGYIPSPHVGYAVGENIAWETLWLASPKAIVASWMSDAGHRANILDATFRDTGIGVAPHPLASLAHGQPGANYTQDFGHLVTR
ncbi:MAG TPA: CAP domain-containing protein [Solirubrobacteraceae bacterium]